MYLSRDKIYIFITYEANTAYVHDQNSISVFRLSISGSDLKLLISKRKKRDKVRRIFI